METFVHHQGVRLWTVAEGSGLPIVLCGGGPGCCDYLEPVARLLPASTRAIRFEPRGCGRSELAPPYSLETDLADLEAIRRHYQVDQWVMAGHSAGADLALLYALTYPQHTLGFICISGGRFQNDREWHRVYSERREQGLERPLEFQFPPNLEVNQQVNRSWKLYCQRPTLFKEISQLARPGLFIYGGQDIRPSWPVEQIVQLLPEAQLVRLAEADHHPWLTHADQLQAALQAFIGQFQ